MSTEKSGVRRRVATVNSIVYAVTVLGAVAGSTLTSDSLIIMSIGEEKMLPGGAWIRRTEDGWELWTDAPLDWCSHPGIYRGETCTACGRVCGEPN